MATVETVAAQPGGSPPVVLKDVGPVLRWPGTDFLDGDTVALAPGPLPAEVDGLRLELRIFAADPATGTPDKGNPPEALAMIPGVAEKDMRGAVRFKATP